MVFKILSKYYVFDHRSKLVRQGEWEEETGIEAIVDEKMAKVTVEQLRHGMFTSFKTLVKYATDADFQPILTRKRYKYTKLD